VLSAVLKAQGNIFGTANCSTPIALDGAVFAASSYGTGGGLARIKHDGDKYTAEEVFFTNHMQNHHGGMVVRSGFLYGSDEGRLTCINLKTGDVAWATDKTGKGSIACADDHLYYRNEGGPVLLAVVASLGISAAVVAGLLPTAGLGAAVLLVAAGGVWLARRRTTAPDCCEAPPPTRSTPCRTAS